jgi:tRNA1Val (adenine37-N6)-methyltransferase
MFYRLVTWYSFHPVPWAAKLRKRCRAIIFRTSELAAGVKRLLSPNGHFSLILPPTEMERMLSEVRGEMFVVRECEVWSTPTSGVKRVMAELQADIPSTPTIHEKIIIEDGGRHSYSEEYRALTRDFYLKF